MIADKQIEINKERLSKLQDEAIETLKKLISKQSFSGEEAETAIILEDWLKQYGFTPNRQHNNVWATSPEFDESKTTILLNSHHDTVLPNEGYTKDPFSPIVEDGTLYGLGSNDAGGPLVSLLATFLYFSQEGDVPFNLIFAGTGEEETSGPHGLNNLIPELPNFDYAIVGEPTQMEMATAEKGLIVLECTAKGVSGHAARDVGDNAIYKAMEDINWFKTYEFGNDSPKVGPVKMTVTVINAGTQHNVVPDTCDFTVDIRTTDKVSNEEVMKVVKENIKSDIKEASTRLRPSGISDDHPIVKAAKDLDIVTFGSPTMSDQAMIEGPSVKMGPGDSKRSHTADEYIKLDEIKHGIKTYITLLKQVEHN
ncbi:M20 family metallo-hydrolase [Mangrovivirga cuniculi]|uniref:Acetylornithine deacetylase n=1 Tax=Mangrovivirga cuniculi TaxID=2715131 RepID=A0A4D7JNQ9_9BACT|nr:M20 family metallo-hydrolase [Mangrovivirga cuniculi]QCK16307.1 acetylornithine deacetylase [Mangrovivirga cuniculi]